MYQKYDLLAWFKRISQAQHKLRVTDMDFIDRKSPKFRFFRTDRFDGSGPAPKEALRQQHILRVDRQSAPQKRNLH